eukprot:15432100-Alexandrium_andersonii.AAC.1
MFSFPAWPQKVHGRSQIPCGSRFKLKGNKLEGLKTALPDTATPMQAQAASESAQPPGSLQLEAAEAMA